MKIPCKLVDETLPARRTRPATVPRRKSALTFTGLAVAGVLVSAGAMGCGGDGDGGPVVPPGSACSLSTFSPNYAPEVNLYRWPRFPLRVAFIQDSLFSNERASLVLSGFNNWVAATSGGIAYNVVSDPADANVTVQFVPANGQQVGLTRITRIGDELQSAEISIVITGNQAEDFNTAVHEFGHALGILGHSSIAADMMSTFGNTSGCNCITERDLNTLLTSYCGNFARKSVTPPSGPIVEEVITCNTHHTH